MFTVHKKGIWHFKVLPFWWKSKGSAAHSTRAPSSPVLEGDDIRSLYDCVSCLGGIKNMDGRCIRPTPEELEDFGTPDFTIYNAGQFPCNRYTHYMTSSTSIDVNLKRKEMVILGTQYAGEMKKGLFSVMHYLMPKRGILSLHSGCNMGKEGDVALFFGLSGIVGNEWEAPMLEWLKVL